MNGKMRNLIRLIREPTKAFTTNSNLGAVGLVNTSVNLLEVVRVGDDLVTGDQILQIRKRD